MANIVDSFQTGLHLSLVLLPKLALKLALTALGLVLANTVALCAPYLAWQIWFPTKHDVAAVAKKEKDKSPDKDGHDSNTLSPPARDLHPLELCLTSGMAIALIEGLLIICMADDRPRMSWVMRAGHFAALAVGGGVGLGLVVLSAGGCAKLFVRCLGEKAEGHLKERAGKENGEGWERVEMRDEGREKDNSQERGSTPKLVQ